MKRNFPWVSSVKAQKSDTDEPPLLIKISWSHVATPYWVDTRFSLDCHRFQTCSVCCSVCKSGVFFICTHHTTFGMIYQRICAVRLPLVAIVILSFMKVVLLLTSRWHLREPSSIRHRELLLVSKKIKELKSTSYEIHHLRKYVLFFRWVCLRL